MDVIILLRPVMSVLLEEALVLVGLVNLVALAVRDNWLLALCGLRGNFLVEQNV